MPERTRLAILAAGKGTRMNRPGMPKVLTPFRDSTIIERQLAALSTQFPDPLIVVGYEGEKVRQHLGDGYDYAWQHEQRGTGHALACALAQLDDAATVVVIPGDHPLVRPEILVQVRDLQDRAGAVGALAALDVPHFESPYDNFRHFGRVFEDDGFAREIVEYKDASDDQRAHSSLNTGFYSFSVPWLSSVIGLLDDRNAASELYLTDLARLASERGERFAVLHTTDHRTCRGVNTPDDLAAAERMAGERFV